MLWCGIVVGASGGYLSSNYLSEEFEQGSEIIYETFVKVKD